MKDWMDRELEFEGLVNRRTEAQRKMEERLAASDTGMSGRFAASEDARRLKSEHAAAHQRGAAMQEPAHAAMHAATSAEAMRQRFDEVRGGAQTPEGGQQKKAKTGSFLIAIISLFIGVEVVISIISAFFELIF